MKLAKIMAGVVAGVVAMSTMAVAASAEDMEITTADGKVANIQKVGVLNGTACEGDVTVGATSWDCDSLVNEGFWIFGGDNGNAGITIDMIKAAEKIEIGYKCDNPLEGAKIGGIFKLHLDESQKLADNGGYAFNDYLPAGWTAYGPQGEEGKGVTVDSLKTFGSAQIEEEGVVSINTADFIAALGTDIGDYLMGIGLGVDNDGVSEELEDEVYAIDFTSLKLVGGAAAETTAPAEEETTAPTADETTAADTQAPGASSGNNNNSGNGNGNEQTGVALVVVPVVLAGGALVASAVLLKKKNK